MNVPLWLTPHDPGVWIYPTILTIHISPVPWQLHPIHRLIPLQHAYAERLDLPICAQLSLPPRRNYHHSPCKIDPISGVENHLPLKDLLYSVHVIWQPRTIVDLVRHPVPHDFPIVLANISHGCGDD